MTPCRVPPRRPAVAVVAAVAAVVVFGLAGSGCSDSDGADGAQATTTSTGSDGSGGCVATEPEALVPDVVRTVPHDPDVYTQGLLLDGGVLYESAGRYGESELRAVDPSTGEELHAVSLPDDVFGEGLAVGSNGELVQLTWQEGIAYRWDPVELERDDGRAEPLGEFSYEGEGWGLTALADGTLAMSDGSDTLSIRNLEDFDVVTTHRVTRADGPTDELNELEWDGTSLWANRYQSDEILRIDPDCWTVTGVVDMSTLHADATEAADDAGDPIDVTNGIAHVPRTDQFLVTGKWWPKMYEVRFVPA
jgi:glutaminyl-peptide cyclotransferase